MSVPHLLLGLLDTKPRHGYDLKRSYDTYFGTERAVRFGQVYSTLARLHRDNLVRVAETEAGGGPERTMFAITPRGTSDVDSWLSEPVSPEPYLQPVLFQKVVLALLSGRQAEEMLARQRAAHVDVMRSLTAERRSTTPVRALAADYALFHLEADLRWIELTTARLAALSKELNA